MVKVCGRGKVVELSRHDTMQEASEARERAEAEHNIGPFMVSRPKEWPAPVLVKVEPDYHESVKAREPRRRANRTTLAHTLTTAQEAALNDYLVDCSRASQPPTIVGARAATACHLAEEVFVRRLKKFAERGWKV